MWNLDVQHQSFPLIKEVLCKHLAGLWLHSLHSHLLSYSNEVYLKLNTLSLNIEWTWQRIFFSWNYLRNSMHICTGWPKSKFVISPGCNSETMHFWTHVGKAKMCLRGVHLFWFFSCMFTFFQLIVYNFQNKCTPFKRILALPTWVQKCIVSEL